MLGSSIICKIEQRTVSMSYFSILVTTIVSERRQNTPDLGIASLELVANHALSGPAEDDNVAMLKDLVHTI
jgi:hypothetical protein